jgi:hypothetical protein
MADRAGEQGDTEATVLAVDTPGVSVTITAPVTPLIDPETGLPFSPEELEVRRRIEEDRARGEVAIDPVYYASADFIHEPLHDERGTIVEDALIFNRANKTRLVVNFGDIEQLAEDDRSELENLAITIAGRVGGAKTAELMKHLYVLANDAGRTGRFTVSINALLDALKYKRDDRGIHRSKPRQFVSQALFALLLTQVGVNVTGREGSTRGFVAPLLSGIEYQTAERATELTPQEIFGKGLPESVTIQINPLWYRLRDAQGRMVNNPFLVSRALLTPSDAQSYRGRRRTSEQALAAYLGESWPYAVDRRIIVTRDALLRHATITDRNRANATKTLARALDRLSARGILASYDPRPLPLEPKGLITLVLADALPLFDEEPVIGARA